MARLVSVLFVLLAALPALAQTPSTPAPPPEPDYPIIRVGVLSYLQYLAEIENRDGLNAFDVTRAYLNVNGQLARNVRFRFTPDVRRITDGSLAGSLTVRMKHAYVQVDNLTARRWLAARSWLRFGLQSTPWVDFEQGINRYRVQGTMFSERDGLIPSSSDFGASYQTPLFGEYLELHTGVFNGEGSSQTDPNKYKSLQTRVTLRLLPGRGIWNGLRLSTLGSAGWYAEDRPRHLGILMASFEHRHVVAAVQTLKAVERPLATLQADIDRAGESYFLEVRQGVQGWAGIFRVDQFDPDSAIAANQQRRTIAGGAYWFVWPRSRVGVVVTNERVDYTAPTRADDNRLLVQTHVEF